MAKSDAAQDEKIVREARDRFRRCANWEGKARARYWEDIKFANGDARNLYQWPKDQRDSRDVDLKPCFTINEVYRRCAQIINDARQNKMAIVVKATGGDASAESAQVFSGLIRHIEYQSNAQNVYTTAVRTQVQGGVGYWRVVTDYADEDSFDQEIFIRRIKDPMSVYLDPDCTEADRSDARFGFIFDTLPKDEAEKQWPDLKDRFPKDALAGHDGWVDENHVRIAEYFRREERPDELVAVTLDPQGPRLVKRLSEIVKDPRFEGVKPKDIRRSLEDAGAQFRPVKDHFIMWYKIAGDMVVDSREWPGKYVPIVMVIGEETVINGEMDRKGHTRQMIDAQMNYNYWTSEATAQVALQTKAPWIASARAIEGYEQTWDNANRKNFPYLPYNDIDDEGNEVAKPERIMPPVMADAYIKGMQITQDELRATSGQFQSSYGAPGNETSGVAIQARQRQADNATYHFVDHLANAIRYTGRIIIDLIPKIYDTQRVIKIMADDGTMTEVMLDPSAGQALVKQEAQQEQEAQAIFNPNVGKYSVEADVGPAFATQREAAFNAMSQIAQKSPQVMQIAGDLIMKAADFPMAEELAERFRRTIPANILGDAPPPEVTQLQQQLQGAQQMIGALSQQLQQAKSKQDNANDKTMIDAYRAETDRIDVLKDAIFTDERMAMLLAQATASEALGLNPNAAVTSAPSPLTQPPETAPMAPQQPDQPQPAPAGFSMPEGQQ
jgi:hypothetical protein